jgi:hypothetical protein
MADAAAKTAEVPYERLTRRTRERFPINTISARIGVQKVSAIEVL